VGLRGRFGRAMARRMMSCDALGADCLNGLLRDELLANSDEYTTAAGVVVRGDVFGPTAETDADVWASVEPELHRVMGQDGDLVRQPREWSLFPGSIEENAFNVWRNPIDVALEWVGISVDGECRAANVRSARARAAVRQRMARIAFLTECVRHEKPGLRNMSANRLLLKTDIIPRVLKDKCPSLRLCGYNFYIEAILAAYWGSDSTSDLLRQWQALNPPQEDRL